VKVYGLCISAWSFGKVGGLRHGIGSGNTVKFLQSDFVVDDSTTECRPHLYEYPPATCRCLRMKRYGVVGRLIPAGFERVCLTMLRRGLNECFHTGRWK